MIENDASGIIILNNFKVFRLLEKIDLGNLQRNTKLSNYKTKIALEKVENFHKLFNY
jgi:hypothetical protein